MPVQRLGIITGETYFRSTLAREAHQGYLSRNAHHAGVALPPLDEVSDTDPLPAFVNEGRWLVQCPCGVDVQFVFSDELLYMCAACWNDDVGGVWRTVAFPEDREEIEGALLQRRKRQHQNYALGQTLDDLLDENARLAETGGLT